MNKAVPFSRGFNFSAWLETHSSHRIQFSKYSYEDFQTAKLFGADVIRLPIHFHAMSSGPPHYTIDATLLTLLDIIVGWAESAQIFLIIDNHSFDPKVATPTNISSTLIAIWTQIASRYRGRGPFVIYEILNEPHNISDELWGEIQARTIESIRRVDDQHWIVVGGAEWNSIAGMKRLPEYSGTKLLYTFHFYDPFVFTHQGASWSNPSMEPLCDVPFPADAGPMPALPSTLANSWIALQFNKYSEIAALPVLERRFDEVVEFANRRNVPVFCGEYGVFMTNCQKAHRTRWYQIVTEFMDRRRIPRTSWDYRGGFGVFENEWSTRLQFNTDLLLAMGFTPQAIVRRPISVDGMAFHADFFPPGCSAGTWDDQAELDFFNTDTPFSRFAVRWGNAHRYGTFWIIFAEPLDLTKQVRDGHALQFLARTRDKVEFEVRFMNSKPIPWRMRVNVTPRLLPPDGEWHAVRLPLDAMVDVGAWVPSDNTMRRPEGQFSWAAVERLEFVPETADMKGKYVQFDSIVLAKAAYA